MEQIRRKLDKAQDRYVDHALERIQQRKVSFYEIRYVLRNGYHEKRKDVFKEEHKAWNYSVRGKTLDQRSLRIALTFDDNNMLVITVIDLDK